MRLKNLNHFRQSLGRNEKTPLPPQSPLTSLWVLPWRVALEPRYGNSCILWRHSGADAMSDKQHHCEDPSLSRDLLVENY